MRDDPADRGRTAVYSAELAAFDGTSHERVVAFADVVELASSVMGAAWWPRGSIAIVPTRSDARTSSTCQGDGAAPVVRLAPTQLTPATLVHELAHVLAGVGAAHGPCFRRAHLDIVGFALGPAPADWLGDAYRAHGVTIGGRSWPAPPVGPGGPIAL